MSSISAKGAGFDREECREAQAMLLAQSYDRVHEVILYSIPTDFLSIDVGLHGALKISTQSSPPCGDDSKEVWPSCS